MKRCCHTHFTRGQRVRITLTDGTTRVRRFIERRSREIVVETDGGREHIATRLLKSVSIYKG